MQWLLCLQWSYLSVFHPLRRTAEGREAITSRPLWRWLWRHCWGPVVANTAARGANRAESLTLSLWACRLNCGITRSNAASAHLTAEKVGPISIHHHLLVNPCFFSSPPSLPPSLHTYFLLPSALVYSMLRNTLLVKHCFELKKEKKKSLSSLFSFLNPPLPRQDCLTVRKFFL